MKIPGWKKIKSENHLHQWEHERQDVTVSVKRLERGFWSIQINGEQFAYRPNFDDARGKAMASMMSTRFFGPDYFVT